MRGDISAKCIWVSPESSNVIEVGDGSADLLVVPRSGLWLVLDHVVLHVTAQDNSHVGYEGDDEEEDNNEDNALTTTDGTYLEYYKNRNENLVLLLLWMGSSRAD